MIYDTLLPLWGALAQASPEPETTQSALDLLAKGGIVGYIILGLSVVAMFMGVVHVVQIREAAMAPQRIVDELDTLLAHGEAGRALDYCNEPANGCFLTHVIGAGLSRYQRSAFGSLELKGALEEAGQEQVARLMRSTEGLALVAGIAPMLGLLGTVVGINKAFATISSAQGFTRPDQLAGDISLALVTTILGLALAIPATAAVTFFRNRIESLSARTAVTVGELAAHLEGEAGPGPNGVQAAPPRPAGQAAMPPSPPSPPPPPR